MMPWFAMTYVIYWPERAVLKVGRTSQWSRIEAMKSTGGQVLVLARGTDATWEREALRVLARWFPTAFDSELEAWALMPYGRGWTECFSVPHYYVQLAVDLCFEGFARGNDQGVNEERSAQDQRGGSRVSRVSAGAARGETDGDRAVDEGDGRRGAVPAGAGVDRRGDLPGRGGDGAGDSARADARGVGVPREVRARRGGDPVAVPPAEGGHTWGVVGVSAAAARSSEEFRGYGGSGRAGAGGGAGACRAGRAGRGVGGLAGAGRAARAAASAAAARCPADRLRRPSERPPGGLRAVWYRASAARSLGGAAAVHGSAGRVGGAG